MPIQKVLIQDKFGQVSLSEAGGKVSLALELEGQALIDAGFDLAKAKFPSVAVILDKAKEIIDAEIAKA